MLEFHHGYLLKENGFCTATSDLCFYVPSEGEIFLIAVNVDDILLAGKMMKEWLLLSKLFHMTSK